MFPHVLPRWVVGANVPSFWRQRWGMPSRVEYVLPQRVLLPPSTVPSPHLCGLSCGVTLACRLLPSWTMYQHAWNSLLPWLWATFAEDPG